MAIFYKGINVTPSGGNGGGTNPPVDVDLSGYAKLEDLLSNKHSIYTEDIGDIVAVDLKADDTIAISTSISNRAGTATLIHTGKNILDQESFHDSTQWVASTQTSGGYEYLLTLPGGTYTISIETVGIDMSGYVYVFVGSTRHVLVQGKLVNSSITFDINQSQQIRIFEYQYSITDISSTSPLDKVQIEVGDVATDFEEYKVEKISVTTTRRSSIINWPVDKLTVWDGVNTFYSIAGPTIVKIYQSIKDYVDNNSGSGGVNFTVDDTLNLSSDDVLSVAKPVKTLTTEEYNALTTEERMADVIYAIVDDADATSPGVGSGLTEPDVLYIVRQFMIEHTITNSVLEGILT